jgi:hypothetical protein
LIYFNVAYFIAFIFFLERYFHAHDIQYSISLCALSN